MGADRLGVQKALRLIHRRPVGQSDDRTDPRRRHQPATDGILPHLAEQHLVQGGELLAEGLADDLHRLDDRGQAGKAVHQIADPRLEPVVADDAHL